MNNELLFWYTLEEIQSDNEPRSLLAAGLLMWGNCYLEEPPAHFGEMMVIIGAKLGICATPENLNQMAKDKSWPEKVLG